VSWLSILAFVLLVVSIICLSVAAAWDEKVNQLRAEKKRAVEAVWEEGREEALEEAEMCSPREMQIDVSIEDDDVA
jgi:hypothetical protein